MTFPSMQGFNYGMPNYGGSSSMETTNTGALQPTAIMAAPDPIGMAGSGSATTSSAASGSGATTSTSSPTGPGLSASSPGLIIDGQNYGGGFNFTMPLGSSPSLLLNEAAGLTQNAFATDTGFMSNVMSGLSTQQTHLTNLAYGQLANLTALGNNAVNQASIDNQATANSGGGGSYITTAVVESGVAPAGTLEQMMIWRETWLMKQPWGAAVRARYERWAPAIVRRLDARADARRIYRRMYRHFIAPALDRVRADPRTSGPAVAQLYAQLMSYARRKAHDYRR